jgi:hypothetical protein
MVLNQLMGLAKKGRKNKSSFAKRGLGQLVKWLLLSLLRQVKGISYSKNNPAY